MSKVFDCPPWLNTQFGPLPDPREPRARFEIPTDRPAGHSDFAVRIRHQRTRFLPKPEDYAPTGGIRPSASLFQSQDAEIETRGSPDDVLPTAPDWQENGHAA
jgi:hypothetical protein